MLGEPKRAEVLNACMGNSSRIRVDEESYLGQPCAHVRAGVLLAVQVHHAPDVGCPVACVLLHVSALDLGVVDACMHERPQCNRLWLQLYEARYLSTSLVDIHVAARASTCTSPCMASRQQENDRWFMAILLHVQQDHKSVAHSA